MNDVFPDCTCDCKQCLSDPKKCKQLKYGIQLLMNQGTFLVEKILADENVSTLEIT